MNVIHSDARTALLEAAIKCFAEFGYSGASTRMIATKAGRPLSLIGHHFGGKDGLYVESFKYLFSMFSVQPRGIRGEDYQPPKNRQEAIRQLRELIHSFYQETCLRKDMPDELHQSGRRLMLFELRTPRPDVLELIKGNISPWVETLRDSLRVLKPDSSEVEIAFLGTTIMGGITTHSLMSVINQAIWGDMELTPFKAAELLTEHCLQGLGIAPYPD